MTTVVVDALQVGTEPTGVARLVETVLRDLADLPPRFAVELRCTRESGAHFATVCAGRVRVRTPLSSNRPRWRRILYQQLVAPVRDDARTVLVCVGDQAPVWGRARVLLCVNDARRLVRPQTSGVLERVFYRALVPRAARHAAVLATISDFSRAELRKALGASTAIEVVPPHVPLAPRAGGRADGHVLVVGAARPYKHVETVVAALALLPETLRRRVVVAGPTEGRERELRDLAAHHGVAAHVELAGWVDEATLRRLYETAAATVSASSYEGFGLPVAESLAHGLPTIASDIPAHREVAGDAAAYFAPGDEASLAERLRAVLADPAERQRLVAAARRRAEELPTGGRWRELVLRLAGDSQSASGAVPSVGGEGSS
jgi:glycosyltransferase involved in cell wall biosynthesis